MKQITVGVKIKLKKEILDIQGRAVHETLEKIGFSLEMCRVGKYIELTLEAQDHEEAKDRADEISRKVLINPLIEEFELEIL